jgi:hypothetical protein
MTRPSFRGGIRCPTDTVGVAAVGIVWSVGGRPKCRGDNDDEEDF